MYRKLKIKLCKLAKADLRQSLTKSERYVIMILLKMIKSPAVNLMLHPEKNRYYIQNSDKSILIICDIGLHSDITFINHHYNYTITLRERAGKHFHTILINEIKRRRKLLEQQFLNNTENSLRIFLNDLFK